MGTSRQQQEQADEQDRPRGRCGARRSLPENDTRLHNRHSGAILHRSGQEQISSRPRPSSAFVSAIYAGCTRSQASGLVFAAPTADAASRRPGRGVAERIHLVVKECPNEEPHRRRVGPVAHGVADVRRAGEARRPKAKTHVVATEVVKADVAGKKLTVKGPNNTEMTMPCEGKAVAELQTVTAGEKVDVVCRDNDKGEHQARWRHQARQRGPRQEVVGPRSVRQPGGRSSRSFSSPGSRQASGLAPTAGPGPGRGGGS